MTTRKNFNYVKSTAEQIAEQFATATRQAIWYVRNHYKDDPVMSAKLTQAWKLYKIAKINSL